MGIGIAAIAAVAACCAIPVVIGLGAMVVDGRGLNKLVQRFKRKNPPIAPKRRDGKVQQEGHFPWQ